jgi:putative transposase
MTHPIHGLALRRGELALYKGQLVEIEAVLGFDAVQIKDLVAGSRLEVEISHLSRCDSEVDSATDQTDFKPTGKWREIAEFRLEVIKPLLNCRDRTRADVEARATEFNYRPNALYKWIAAYEGDGTLSSLGRKQRSDASRTIFDSRTEDLISTTLKELKPKDKHFTEIYKTIRDKIAAANAQEKANNKDCCCDGSVPGNFRPMEIPSAGTVRNRFLAIPRRQKYSRLHGARSAEHMFDPILGSFPGANCPLDVVQIDHTLLDIMLVDEKHRKPIKRPWLTLTFDVCSRMVTGIYSSIDPPGAMSTGLCIAHSILPKEEWLSGFGSDAQWPVWGKMTALHGDNAFRMKMLKVACKDHKIDLIWRPVKNPKFGGHIERWCGTLAQAIHSLPGTTFSNPKERGTYDSEAKAIFTPTEFNQWLIERIAAYHAEEHSQLGMSPLDRYRIGIFDGTDTHPAVGLQPRIQDPKDRTRLQLDFMPFEERTVQRYGIEIDKIFYYHDVLRRWINAPDPNSPKLKRLFRFRRFYAHLNSVWFYDSDLDDYFEIPTRDSTFPDMSIWDLKQIRCEARAARVPNSQIDEEYLKQRYLRMREQEEAAAKKTKAARSKSERHRMWDASPKPQVAPAVQNESDFDSDIVEPYVRVRGFD